MPSLTGIWEDLCRASCVPQYLLGKQRKLCGSGKKYLAWRKHHVSAAKKLQKINTASRQRQLNRYKQNGDGIFEGAKPGDGTPRVKNRASTQPLQPADSHPPSAYTERRITHHPPKADLI
jgi:hypothetical protein